MSIRRQNLMHLRLALMALVIGSFFASALQAQQPSPAAQSVTQPAAATPQEMAKTAHNPFEDFVKLPIESTIGFNIGPHHNTGESTNIQPLFPVRLSTGWDLIAQPSLSATYIPSPHEQFGLQDLQASFFLTPHRATKWLWGVGPIFQFPTATAKALGTGRWSAGPTAAVIYSNGPWFNGVLAYQLMSFAGNRDRGSVNQTYIEPQISYNFESGWYVDWNPSITFDWTADTANGWTLPMGADIGKAFDLGAQATSLQGGAYYLVKRPDGTPQWVMRVQLTFLFPTGN